MAENTKIEWCTHTYNPWIGCAKVGPACDHCYAEDLMDVRYKRVKWGTGEARVRTSEQTRNAPFKWDRAAAKAGKKATVFCLSLGDIWDNEVDPLWRREAFDVMRATPNLIYLLLSKRIGNAVRMADEVGRFPPNAALGATMVSQSECDRDVLKLLKAAQDLDALFTFVSIEPMLGSITLVDTAPWGPKARTLDALSGLDSKGVCQFERGIDWVIVGGESGRQARPMHPQWVRDLRDECDEHGTAFFLKQWGEWITELQSPDDIILPGTSTLFWGDDVPGAFRVGKHAAGRLLDGIEHNGFPKEIA